MLAKYTLGTIVGLVVVYLIFPVFVVVLISFSSANFLDFPPPGLSLQWYAKILNNPDWVRSFWVTLRVSLLAAILATLLGVPAAFALVRYAFRGKAAVNALILAALITPPIVAAVSTYLFFAPLGLVNSIVGLAFVHVVGCIPFVVINTAASLRSSDPTLELAAIIHGATPAYAVRRITLPIVAPGIVIGFIFAFVNSAHELLVSMFLLGGVGMPVSVKMWTEVQSSSDPSIAAASSMLIGLAVITFTAVVSIQRFIRRTPK
jgi:putative spermidine/putrescine transport system permease protein